MTKNDPVASNDGTTPAPASQSSVSPTPARTAEAGTLPAENERTLAKLRWLAAKHGYVVVQFKMQMGNRRINRWTTLEAMDLHVDNPLYERLRAALEQSSTVGDSAAGEEKR